MRQSRTTEQTKIPDISFGNKNGGSNSNSNTVTFRDVPLVPESNSNTFRIPEEA